MIVLQVHVTIKSVLSVIMEVQVDSTNSVIIMGALPIAIVSQEHV